MKLLLAGGILAQGVRPAVSREDRLMEKTAWADYFFRTYGWTWQQLRDQPFWLVARLPEIGNMRAEIEKEQIDRA